jgi:hypothetical protein
MRQAYFFCTLQCGDEDNNSALTIQTLINDDGVEIPPPTYDKICTAIQRMKNNRAAGPGGLTAELFKTGCGELVGYAAYGSLKAYPMNVNSVRSALSLRRETPQTAPITR